MKCVRIFIVVMLIVGPSAFATTGLGPDVYLWSNAGGATGTTMSGVIAAGTAHYESANCTAGTMTGTGFADNLTYLGITSGEYRWLIDWNCNLIAGGSQYRFTDVIQLDVTGSCVAPGVFNTSTGECEQPATCPVEGLSFIKSGSGSKPASFCDQGCSFTPQSGGANVVFQDGWIGMYTASGACDPDSGGISTGNNCIQTAGGTQYCADNTAQENCGTINGEYVCLDSVPPGNCILTAGGQAICDSGSQTNPPDETITTDSGQTLDIYGSGTSTGGDVGGTGATTGAGDGTDPAGTAGSGEAQPGDCDGTNCVGVLPTGNEVIDGYGTLFGTFYGRVEGAPIIAAFSGISGSMPVGSCQGVDSDPLAFLNGEVISIDIHCSLWPTIVPILSGVMLAVWSLIGGLIILRA